MTVRLAHNGTKARFDGNGDAWSEDHRKYLHGGIMMQDVDALLGVMAFAMNAGERFFWEYVSERPAKDIVNWQSEFAIVAMFDRKRSMSAVASEHSINAKPFYMWLCRHFGRSQPVAPLFYYVVGNDSPPWEMVNVDIVTGDVIGNYTLHDSRSAWQEFWTNEGLYRNRYELEHWLRGRT